MTSDILFAGFSAESLFGFSSQLAMLGWLILIIFPRKIAALSIIPQYIIPFGLSLLYSTLALIHLLSAEGGFDSLANLRLLFQNDAALLAGWLHYLAFDLFIGAWIAQQADILKISRIVQAPILIATFLLGPIGLALFLVMRSIVLSMEESKDA
ncbi:DUF4281 domain-containing protein [Kangiella sp. HD9-110m-PIT-SAG07]|nr:DUF4281 domain-containing protein [Kangiella sp. HD9-110m-PIT-SAG07]